MAIQTQVNSAFQLEKYGQAKESEMINEMNFLVLSYGILGYKWQ